jgi:MOSC domain-containing protein YiiM
LDSSVFGALRGTTDHQVSIVLVSSELHDELRERGFEVAAGEMGENVTTRGIDLLGLPAGTRLRLGAEAEVEITGLRNPCKQLEGIAPGLMKATLERRNGDLVRKAGQPV